MKPTNLKPLNPNRRLFRTKPTILHNEMVFAGVVATIGTLGLLASIIWS